MAAIQLSLDERLWGRILMEDGGLPPGCWEFMGAKARGGYGRIKKPGERVGSMAHRVAWELTNGPIPVGLLVLHRCDNPPCIRPDHLFLGTYKDNTADMFAKGRDRGGWGACPTWRKPRGEDHGNAKLTEVQVLAIRARRQEGLTFRAIAAEFGVCRQTAANIVQQRRWSHIA